MILNPRQIQLMRLGLPIVPANFGGDSDSDSSTRTTNDTQNNATSTDKRAVGSDQAIALTGDGNAVAVDRSSTTNFMDSSNRSTTFTDLSNRSTNFADTSNRSSTTTFTDNSNRSVTNVNTDFGSVNAALGLGGTMTTKAFDTAGKAIDGAIDTLKLQTKTGADMVSKAFDLSKSAAANAQASSAQVLGFATTALQATQSALTDAKDSGQSKMVMAALVVIGVIGVAYALKK